MSDLVGRWVQEAPFSNMDAFLEAAGITDPQVKAMITSLKPELELSQDGEQWEFKMITASGSRTTSFKSGQEIDYVSIVGRPVKSTITVDGNCLTEVHKDPGNAAEVTHITRQVSGDQMNVVLKFQDVEATAAYKRV